MTSINQTRCRFCGATEPKPTQPGNFPGNWEVALPDHLEGAVLLDNTEVWCSQECRDSDPFYRPFETGADMFGAYDRFGQAHGLNLIGAFAKSRGVSHDEAKAQLQKGFERGLRQLRKEGKA